MSNSYFQFKQFTIQQDRCAMKVTTDACLFGAWAAEKIKNARSNVKRILDIGTGTGLLSLMIAQKTNALIDTIEIDKDAFEQAKENIALSPWQNRITIFNSDVQQFDFSYHYDIIISNPPFYENELLSPDEKKNQARHSGLSLHELAQVIFKALDAKGQFYLLLPAKRMMEVGLLFPKWELSIPEATLIKQSPSHDYFRLFLAGKHKDNDEERYKKSEMIICNEKSQYTPEFIDLLNDYYLHL
jgi:tRNA1Val (adenine37-N6)-methyltransferase